MTAICPKCLNEVVKAGKSKGKQRYYCRKCNFYTLRAVIKDNAERECEDGSCRIG